MITINRVKDFVEGGILGATLMALFIAQKKKSFNDGYNQGLKESKQ